MNRLRPEDYLRHGDDYEVNTNMPDFYGFVEDMLFELVEDAAFFTDPFGSEAQEAIRNTVAYLKDTSNWGARGGYTMIATIKQTLLEDLWTAHSK